MTDRHATAHALRSAIHGWLKAHPSSRMPAVVDAFPETPAATVRKSVQRLVGLGCVAQVGGSTRTRYDAVGDEIYPADAMRHAPHRIEGLRIARSECRLRVWQMRHDIHAFVKAHPDIRMGALLAGLPEITPASVRKHVRWLCRQHNITLHGYSATATYRAATDSIAPLPEAPPAVGSRTSALVAAPGLTAARRYTNQPHRHAPRKTPDVIGSGGVSFGGHASCERIA